MESSMGEMSTKANKLSKAQDVIDRKVIHQEKKNTCTFVKEEKARKDKVKSVVSTKESQEKRKESECLTKNHESLKEEQEKEKQYEIEKSEETKEVMRLMIFEEDKREGMKESVNSISILELLNYNLWNKANHGMKAKEEGMGKELSIGFEDTSLSLSLNLFLELYASYVTLVGNVMVFHWNVKATKSTIKVLHGGGDLGKVWNENYLQLKIHIRCRIQTCHKRLESEF
ncbi:hypothetical protein M9H77_02558 [Catharanthus roseus]|uniref:Uncharacterized protein n=1 Tax=Catharanthus roseus TaxID=4058 RepID=A0ACC0C8S8_CATRO|nr:hypothetical protein M9H77_02558 [Catharanthus roseus]